MGARQRRLRNYLLDAPLQLRFTAVLIETLVALGADSTASLRAPDQASRLTSRVLASPQSASPSGGLLGSRTGSTQTSTVGLRSFTFLSTAIARRISAWGSGVLAWFAMPYVSRSWAILESSRETSGLPAVFLLKTLIPLFALLMALQGVAQAIRAFDVLHAAR